MMRQLAFVAVLALVAARAAGQGLLHAEGSAGGGSFSSYAVRGDLVPPLPAIPPDQHPTLVGQCSTSDGRTTFDLFLYPAGLATLRHEGPWKRTLEFPEPVQHLNFTLSAVGYHTAKMGKFSFERIPSPAVHYHYLHPGMRSANLADFPTLFPYLRSLPVLRVSTGLITAEFPTGELLRALEASPACAALPR